MLQIKALKLDFTTAITHFQFTYPCTRSVTLCVLSSVLSLIYEILASEVSVQIMDLSSSGNVKELVTYM